MIGGSKKKTTNTSNNYDQSVGAQSDSLAFGGHDNNVAILDGGAVAGAFDFGSEALDFGGASLTGSFDIAERSISSGEGFFRDASAALSNLFSQSTAALQGSQIAALAFAQDAQRDALSASNMQAFAQGNAFAEVAGDALGAAEGAGTAQQKAVYAALALAGLVVLFKVFK